MPNRSRISDVGMLASAYSRATSRCCSGLSLRRRDRSELALPACAPSVLSMEGSSTSSTGSTMLNCTVLSSCSSGKHMTSCVRSRRKEQCPVKWTRTWACCRTASASSLTALARAHRVEDDKTAR